MNQKLQLLVLAVLALILSQHVWASPIIGRRQESQPAPDDGQPTGSQPPEGDGQAPNGGTPDGGQAPNDAPQQPDLGPFQYCDENQKGTIEFSKIGMTPLPIVPGENVTFVWEGKSTAAIQNNAKLVVTSRIGDQKAQQNEHDICKESNQTCPIEPFTFSDNVTEAIPEELASSAGQNLTLTLNATNGDGSLLYCLIGNIPIGEPDNGGQGSGSGGGGGGSSNGGGGSPTNSGDGTNGGGGNPTNGGESGSGTGGDNGGSGGSGFGTGGDNGGSGVSGSGDNGGSGGSDSGTGGENGGSGDSGDTGSGGTDSGTGE